MGMDGINNFNKISSVSTGKAGSTSKTNAPVNTSSTKDKINKIKQGVTGDSFSSNSTRTGLLSHSKTMRAGSMQSPFASMTSVKKTDGISQAASVAKTSAPSLNSSNTQQPADSISTSNPIVSNGSVTGNADIQAESSILNTAAKILSASQGSIQSNNLNNIFQDAPTVDIHSKNNSDLASNNEALAEASKLAFA